MVCLPIPPRRQGAKPVGFYSIRLRVPPLSEVVTRLAGPYFGIWSDFAGAVFGATGAVAGAAGAAPEGADPGICEAGEGMSVGAAGADGTPCGTVPMTPPVSDAGRLTAVPV